MSPLDRAASLKIWTGNVDPVPLDGGITNMNFVVADAGRRYVVRIGGDIPEHNVVRWHETVVSRAAAAAGLSPAVVHAEPGVLVLDFIESRTFTDADVQAAANLPRLGALIRRMHIELPQHLQGPLLAFWPFQVNRNYIQRLRANGSRHTGRLDALARDNADLEWRFGATALVFGHNDLLPGNILDDGRRLWLIDWEYAGFNTPYFDLGGLASNARLNAGQTATLLEAYWGRAATVDDTRTLALMQAVSLLREALWSMVSEQHSTLHFDYAGYTETLLQRYAAARSLVIDPGR